MKQLPILKLAFGSDQEIHIDGILSKMGKDVISVTKEEIPNKSYINYTIEFNRIYDIYSFGYNQGKSTIKF